MKTATIHLGDGSLLYTKFHYPAGEMQVRLTPAGLEMIEGANEIRIIARISSADDLMELALLRSTLGACSVALPYLPYARADRRFVPGDCFGLAAFANIINSIGFDEVRTLDAHSHMAGELIEDLKDVSALPLIERAIHKFSALHHSWAINVLFPDDGALARYKVPDAIGNNHGEIRITKHACQKRRDAATGKLSGFTVPTRKQLEGLPTLIVDDICDGGGTFLGIADALNGNPTSLGLPTVMGLYVTHGIFSKGFDALRAKFSRIYTTDTMGLQHSHENVHTFESHSVIWDAKE